MGDDRPSALPPLGIIQEEEHFLLPNTLYAEPAITQENQGGLTIHLQSDTDLLIRPKFSPLGASTPVLNKKMNEYLDEIMEGEEMTSIVSEPRLNSELEIKNQHYEQQKQYKRNRIDKNLLAIDYDGILQLTGGCKKWQIIMYMIISLQQIPHAMFNLSVVYMMYTPEHWCKVPGFTQSEVNTGARNVSWEQFSRSQVLFPMKSSNMNLSISDERRYSKSGGFAQCSVYDRDYSLYNESSWDELKALPKTSEVGCSSWEYDTSVMEKTVVSQFNLLCDNNMSRAHLHLAYSLGYLVGCVVGGIVSDKYGRQFAIFFYAFISLFFGIVLYLTDNFYVSKSKLKLHVFLFIRFCLAISNEAGDIAAYVYCMEITGTEYRSIVGSLMHAPWALGYALLALLGYLTKSWSAIHIITVSTHFIALIAIYFLDESPRWLIVQNKKSHMIKAESIIRKVCEINKTTLPSDLGIIKHAEMAKWKKEHTTIKQFMSLYTSKKLIARSISLFFIWASTALVYYGLVIALSDQSAPERSVFKKAFFINNAIAGMLELPTLAIGCVVLMRFGRKNSLMFCLVFSAISLIMAIFANDDVFFLLSMFLAKCFIQGAFNVLYIFTTELSPTVLRNSFIGINSMISRLGSGASGYVAILSDVTFPKVPMIIFSGLCVAASLFVWTLPETIHSPLPDTIWDAVKLHNPRKPCLSGEEPEEEEMEERKEEN
ncbi:hypothetical protein PRIPAC_90651 [Pristionchus pacificus]|uniref:Membrane transporter n=1 Tax=Pristionchus pacificus TaxID=54126 RepID=A0A2A6B6Q5_PRIPA|nr:hypothetical protein PRIPAC_90651 [Pristionchus pacificus]|eukprot:PDM61569.1 membrane transporter [Pristionchus pacificus]